MSVVSKHVGEVLKNRTCRELLHPGRTCKQNVIYKILVYPDHFKAIFPFFLINLFLNRKRFKHSSVQAIWDCFRHVMPLSLATYNLTVFGNVLMCGFWHCFGGFRYYFAILIPCMLATLAIPMAHGTDLMTGSLVNFTIDALIKQLNFSKYKYLVTSRKFGALVFAMLSGFISYSYKNDKLTNAWVINPMGTKQAEEDVKKLCNHQSTCLAQILKTVLKYLGIALSISIGKKVIFNPALLKNPKLIFHNFDTKFVKFFTFYAGLFRAINCLTRNAVELDWGLEKFLTGFLSGLTFGIAPQKLMFSMAIITAGKYFWKDFKTKRFDGPLKYAKKLPMHRIVLAYTTGYILHSMVFFPHSTPKFGMWVIDRVTSGQLLIAQTRFAEFIFSPK